jgi:insulysin
MSRTLSPNSVLAAAVAARGVRVGGQVRTSPLDNRSYRTLTLANDLRVVLASDPSSEKAAAALDVGVGSFSDPEDLPGLAHFCEHMLFLGTAKYPDEKGYAEHIAKCGGSYNAFTGSEHTNYHFAIASPSSAPREGMGDPLYEALDRFAQFFIAPLFTESATERELNAVDSEHSKNLQNDTWRLCEVMQACANPLHPYSRFNTGSKKTLSEVPAERGIDVRAALLDFHREYYSANLMHLCVTGPHSLDRLQEMVVELFSDIENRSCPLPAEAYMSLDAVTEAEMGQAIYAKTVEERRQIDLFWSLPPIRPAPRSTDFSARAFGTAEEYVSHLLGHEGAGSLTSYLKNRGWIDGLSSGNNGSYEHFSLYLVSISLTRVGVDHVDDIIAAVFVYMRLIGEEGVRHWVYDEMVSVSESAFRFAPRLEPEDLVDRVSQRLAFYPDTEVLRGPYLYTDFDENLIERLLELLCPERMSLMISGQFVSDRTNTVEPWYGTEYGVERIADTRFSAWRQAPPTEDLRIPLPNPFIASDFSLVADSLGKHKSLTTVPTAPVKLVDSDKFELYYDLDRTFLRPNATVNVLFVADGLFGCAESAALCNLAVSLLNDDLSELSYEAELASLSYGLSASMEGISLGVAGYNEKLDTLFVRILDRLATFRATSDRFQVLKDQFTMFWRNDTKKEPYAHASDLLDEYCRSPNWPVSAQLSALESGRVSLDTVNNFLGNVLGSARAIILVSGNVSEEWARAVQSKIENSLPFSSLARRHLSVPRIVQIPDGSDVWARMKIPNDGEENSAVQVLFQVGQHSLDFSLDAAVEILAETLSASFYDELRTKQQLGYIVSAGLYWRYNVQGINFRIQGRSASPAELRRRICSFLVQFREKTLVEMTETEFRAFVDSAIAVKREPDQTLGDRECRTYHEIFRTREFSYDRREREALALEGISKCDVIEVFDRFIAEGAPKRRIFTSCAYGSAHDMHDDDAVLLAWGSRVRVATDPDSFRKERELFPPFGSNLG